MLSITSSTSIYLALRLVHKCACHAHIPTQYLHHTPRTLPRWLWSLSAIAPAQPVAAQPLPSQQTVVHERLSGSAHATRSTLCLAPLKRSSADAGACDQCAGRGSKLITAQKNLKFDQI